jgi:hypothetical protein
MKTPMTVLETEARPGLGRELRRSLVAGILALVVALGIGRFAYTPILPAMQERFDLSNAAAGTLASSNYLEAVMNSIRNGLGIGETEIARKPSRPWNPHFYAVFTQVHNTL